MAVLDGDARSVMHSYAEIDGVPVAADPQLLTGLLRDQWGFDGTVVADYFGVAFLHMLHHVAADLGDAAAQALAAGVDVELPTGDAYLGRSPRRSGPAGSTRRSSTGRCCGCCGRSWNSACSTRPSTTSRRPRSTSTRPSTARIARRLAEESIVLLRNDGMLPLPAGRAHRGHRPERRPRRRAVRLLLVPQPRARRSTPGSRPASRCRRCSRRCATSSAATVVSGASAARSTTTTGPASPSAVAAAAAADVAVLVMGDQAGLFGRGTVGEGCDRDDLELPGVQRELVEAVLATGTPVVLVLLTGRPYAVDWALDRCAAVVQAFFPGEEGAAAIAGVLSGRVNPSGRLPVSLPRSAGAQPYSYLHPALGGGDEVTNLATTPAAPFGHGLSYTTFDSHRSDRAGARCRPTARLVVTVRATNTGAVAGDDVVQLYGRDLVGSVTRPVAQLLGYRRVQLEPGESVTVEFAVPTTRLAFSDRSFTRVVEPGDVELWVGTSSQRDTQALTTLVGDTVAITNASARWTTATEIRQTAVAIDVTMRYPSS